jgi:hypothetical protein
MTKRPKWLDRPEKNVPEHIRKAKGSGRGTSKAIHDVAFWLGDEFDPWVAALEAIDKRKDKGPLLALLKSDHDLPHAARVYLADLLDRYQLKRKKGGQSVAVYDRTDADRIFELANARANELIECGLTTEDACNKAAKDFGIPDRGKDGVSMLLDFRAGKRGGSARMKKRRT